MSAKSTHEQQAAANPDLSVWVSASAGSGKTSVLVNRLLRLMLEGNAPQKLLCITFTKAAAANVLERVQKTAKEWSILETLKLTDDLTTLLDKKPTAQHLVIARRLLPQILQTPGGMKVLTIHAFCQSVLSRFPLEAGITSGFRIADEAEAYTILHEAKQKLLEETTSGPVFDALSFLYGLSTEDSQNDLIESVLAKRYQLGKFLTAFSGDLSAIKKALHARLNLAQDDSSAKHDQEFITPSPLKAIPQIAATLEENGGKTNLDQASDLRAFAKDPFQSLDTYIGIFLTDELMLRKRLITGFKNIPENLQNFFDTESQRALDYAAKKSALTLAGTTLALLTVCSHITSVYQELKAARGVMDYEDQILLTAQLLNDLSDAQWVLYKLDGGIDHILVDEAQDTSPAQWDIVSKIAEEFFSGKGTHEAGDRTVFIVGDEKQSIFSFQNADPVAFDHMRHTLAKQARDASCDWGDIPLLKNFRSSPIILTLTDLCFADPQLQKSLTKSAEVVQHTAHHAEKFGQVELWPLLPKPKEKSSAQRDQPEFILAQYIAEHVQDMLKTDKTLRYGDIMILVRKRHPMVTPLTKAFKDRDIPVMGADRLILREQLAVQDCLAALKVALNAHDNYALACFLKSPFIQLSEQELYTLCRQKAKALVESLNNPEITSYISFLRDIAIHQGPAQFLSTLLNHPCPGDAKSGRHALIKHLGFDADDMLDELLESAKNYELNTLRDCRGFITWIEHNDKVVKRESHDSDKSRVAIMTTHASKGLQARVVILADANSKPESYKSNQDVLWLENRNDGFIWTVEDGQAHPLFQSEKERFLDAAFGEYYRLLYVALTRAEERLIICGWEPFKQSHPDRPSWHTIIKAGFESLTAKKEFAHESFDFHGLEAVRFTYPGKQDTLTKDKNKPSYKAIPDYLKVKALSEVAMKRPLRPSQPVDQEPAAFSPLQEQKEFTFQRGLLLHRIFRVAPEFPIEQQNTVIEKILQEHDLSDKEKSALTAEALSVLHHPDFAFLFTPKARAEVPVIGEVTLDGKPYAISGQIDRLLVDKERVVIVDFKTNRPPARTEAEIPETYRHQLRAYKTLLAQIYPEKKIECALLWTAIPYILPVSV